MERDKEEEEEKKRVGENQICNLSGRNLEQQKKKESKPNPQRPICLHLSIPPSSCWVFFVFVFVFPKCKNSTAGNNRKGMRLSQRFL